MTFHHAKAALLGTMFADVRWVASTGSTNKDMLDLMATPHGDPSAAVVMLAEYQSAGRGRLDRKWSAPAGASILMTIGIPVDSLLPERRTLLTSALAISVASAPSVAGQLSIKWPNDLVAVGSGADGTDRKVGGILAELHSLPGRGDVVLLGIGLNVNWPEIPEELEPIAESLNRLLGAEVDREQLVAEVLLALGTRWMPVLSDRTSAPTELLVAYRERSATLGRRVRVELPTAELFGTAADITATGELVVVDDQNVERVLSVGDVVHLRPT